MNICLDTGMMDVRVGVDISSRRPMTSLLGVFPGQLARNALASLQGPPVTAEIHLALGKEHAGAFSHAPGRACNSLYIQHLVNSVNSVEGSVALGLILRQHE